MSTSMISCPACGAALQADTRFCPVCGRANDAATVSSAQPSQDPQAFATPMAPPSFTASAEEHARGDITVPPSGQPTQYFPPDPQAQLHQTWQAPQIGAYAPPDYAPQPLPEQPATQNLYQYGTQPQAQPPVQAYGQPISTNYQFQPTPGVAGVPQRDPNVAMLLELIGYVWVLGIGHMYAGRITRGLALMLGYWAYGAIVFFMFITVIGIPVACIMALVYPIVPIISAIWIRRDVERDNAIYPTRTY